MSSVIPAVLVNGTPLPSDMIEMSLRITHGRSSTYGQPDSPTAEFVYIGPVAPGKVGDALVVTTGFGGTEDFATWGDLAATWGDAGRTWDGHVVDHSSRFVGTIESVQAVESEGEVVEWNVRGIGELAAWGRINVRWEFPVQDDVARVQALCAKAGVPIGIKGTATLQVAADETDRSLLSALHEVCASTGGLLWQDRAGMVWYGTANHRDKPADWVLPAQAILDGIDWTQSTEQIINSITIRYPAPALPPPPVTGEWVWEASLDTGSDPGTGDMRTNDVNATQVSTIALSRITTNGRDATLDITRRLAGDRLYLQAKDDSTRWARYTLTNAPIDNGNWFQVQVDFKEHGDVGEPVQGQHANMLVSFDSRLEGGERSETFTDDASIAQWGERHVETTTLCADADEAGLLALTILARRAQPFWAMPGVLVPYDDLSDPDVVAMQALDVSIGILVPVENTPTPTPGDLTAWALEGYVEEWRENGYWSQMALTDWARFYAAAVVNYGSVRDNHTYGTARTLTYHQLLVEVS